MIVPNSGDARSAVGTSTVSAALAAAPGSPPLSCHEPPAAGLRWWPALSAQPVPTVIVSAPVCRLARPAAAKLNVNTLPSRVKPVDTPGATPDWVSVTRPFGTVALSTLRPLTGSRPTTTVSVARSAVPSALPAAGESSRAAAVSTLNVPSVTAAPWSSALSSHVARLISTGVAAASDARLPKVNANVLPAPRVTPLAVAFSTPPWNSVTRPAVMSDVTTLSPATGLKTAGTPSVASSPVPIVSGSAPSCAVGAPATLNGPSVTAGPLSLAAAGHVAIRNPVLPGPR